MPPVVRPGEQAAEDQREDAADDARGGKHPTEPSMEGVVPAADPVGELEWCQEEVNRTRHEVKIRQPCLLYVATVEFLLGGTVPAARCGMSRTNRLPTE